MSCQAFFVVALLLLSSSASHALPIAVMRPRQAPEPETFPPITTTIVFPPDGTGIPDILIPAPVSTPPPPSSAAAVTTPTTTIIATTASSVSVSSATSLLSTASTTASVSTTASSVGVSTATTRSTASTTASTATLSLTTVTFVLRSSEATTLFATQTAWPHDTTTEAVFPVVTNPAWPHDTTTETVFPVVTNPDWPHDTIIVTQDAIVTHPTTVPPPPPITTEAPWPHDEKDTETDDDCDKCADGFEFATFEFQEVFVAARKTPIGSVSFSNLTIDGVFAGSSRGICTNVTTSNPASTTPSDEFLNYCQSDYTLTSFGTFQLAGLFDSTKTNPQNVGSATGTSGTFFAALGSDVFTFTFDDETNGVAGGAPTGGSHVLTMCVVPGSGIE
ncbi:hypothetical protein DFJ77DRAFT_539513 [Powellomyces hirtus]|nr:hypothetical protein DFJ77DRAFT_539513 [Powellomyces hirtus]